VHGNVIQMQRRWAVFSRERIALTSTSSTRELDVTMTTAFRALSSSGYDTFCLGATGFTGGRRRDDPRRRLARSKGIDTCSLYDGAHFVGPSIVHDESVIKEAADVVFNRDSNSTPFVLCVNLLSCRHVVADTAPDADDDDNDNHDSNAHTAHHGVDRVRSFKSKDNDLQLKQKVRPSHHDKRMIPPSLGVHISGVLTRVVGPEEYISFVCRALDALDDVDAAIVALIDRMVQCNGVVAMMSTHSLSLGEHGVVGAHAPTASCTQTFWCSSVPLASSLPTLRDNVHSLISTCAIPLAFNTTIPAVVTMVHDRDDEPSTHSRTSSSVLSILSASEQLVRVKCTLQDHTYVCIGTVDRFGVVFDASDDVFETKDVSALIPHLHLSLCTMYTSSVSAMPARDDDTMSVSTFTSSVSTEDDAVSCAASDVILSSAAETHAQLSERSEAGATIQPKIRPKKKRTNRRAVVTDSSCGSISNTRAKSIPEEDVRHTSASYENTSLIGVNPLSSIPLPMLQENVHSAALPSNPSTTTTTAIRTSTLRSSTPLTQPAEDSARSNRHSSQHAPRQEAERDAPSPFQGHSQAILHHSSSLAPHPSSHTAKHTLHPLLSSSHPTPLVPPFTQMMHVQSVLPHHSSASGSLATSLPFAPEPTTPRASVPTTLTSTRLEPKVSTFPPSFSTIEAAMQPHTQTHKQFYASRSGQMQHTNEEIQPLQYRVDVSNTSRGEREDQSSHGMAAAAATANVTQRRVSNVRKVEMQRHMLHR